MPDARAEHPPWVMPAPMPALVSRAGAERRGHGGGPRPGLECHLLSLADLAALRRDPDAVDAVGRAGGRNRTLVRRVGRLLLATVLADHHAAAPGVLRVTADGRPVAPGERAEGARAGIAHDGGVLVVGFHPAGCAVDVEDTPVSLIAEVAGRFCGTAERRSLPAGAAVRGVWTAKEAVAKYTGLGLRAGLRTITFDGDPLAGWVRSHHPGTRRPPLCRVVATGRRHLAFAVGSSSSSGIGSVAAPVVEVHRWVPDLDLGADGGGGSLRLVRARLAPSGELAELADAVGAVAAPPRTGTGPPRTRTSLTSPGTTTSPGREHP
ncbi:4'-phosphopantetheinyl transferase superfamily protein [Frankia sp. Ag45/Mut15]|uniref:4'-phosphopantetheinyl transferase superfamily protein n=1 Tax=Frankia umida TaxID=573489 RepID=A0ABT0JZA8_9ACTN|nr:4'-phosphopantetheinyl transferase superfamily protein [Frankia umida]MCK9876831.1 4'-phosphopantetheinyl transferase superfamily protein [Frankia umida]